MPDSKRAQFMRIADRLDALAHRIEMKGPRLDVHEVANLVGSLRGEASIIRYLVMERRSG